jgi:hypothetical protein
MLPVPGVIASIPIEPGRPNAERAALDTDGTLSGKATASEQKATASKILTQLEVRIEKPDWTVLRYRNIGGLLRTKLPVAPEGLMGYNGKR